MPPFMPGSCLIFPAFYTAGDVALSKDANLDFGHVHPTGMFGGVMELKAPGNAPRFAGHKGLIERGGPGHATWR